jgi:hypothetical protein
MTLDPGLAPPKNLPVLSLDEETPKEEPKPERGLSDFSRKALVFKRLESLISLSISATRRGCEMRKLVRDRARQNETGILEYVASMLNEDAPFLTIEKIYV